jgi:hypothetical protein
MTSSSPTPGDEAARVCLDILRGASQLAQPYAAHLSKLLQEEGREQERALGGLPAGGGGWGAREHFSERRCRRGQKGEFNTTTVYKPCCILHLHVTTGNYPQM